MAHFAKIGMSSKVISVLTCGNGDMINHEGVEDESLGQQYLEKHNNWPREMWIQTSYNTRNNKHYTDGEESADQSKAFRGNYAAIGYTWDDDDHIFWPKKPFASWVKNMSEARWQSPIGDAPDDLNDEEKSAGTYYVWNESGQSWDKTTP